MTWRVDGAFDQPMSRRDLFRAAGSGGIGLVAATVPLGLLAACGSDDNAEKTLRIGVLAPLTGSAAPYGAVVNNAVDAAVKQLNATKGGLPDRKIEILLRDSKSDPVVAA